MHKIAEIKIFKRRQYHKCTYCKAKPQEMVEYHESYSRSKYFCNEECYKKYGAYTILQPNVEKCLMCAKPGYYNVNGYSYTGSWGAANGNRFIIPKTFYANLTEEDIKKHCLLVNGNELIIYNGIKINLRYNNNYDAIPLCKDCIILKRSLTKPFIEKTRTHTKRVITKHSAINQEYTAKCDFCGKKKFRAETLLVKNESITVVVCDEACANLFIMKANNK